MSSSSSKVCNDQTPATTNTKLLSTTTPPETRLEDGDDSGNKSKFGQQQEQRQRLVGDDNSSSNSSSKPVGSKVNQTNEIVKNKKPVLTSRLGESAAAAASAADSTSNVSFFQLLRYSDALDKLLMIVGTLSALCGASIFPLMFFMYGQVAGTLVDFDKIKVFHDMFNTSERHADFNLTRNKFCFKLTKNNIDIDARMDYSIRFYLVIGCISIFFNYLSNVSWNTSANRQIKRMRNKIYETIIRQDIAFFDSNTPGELNSIMTNNIEFVRLGIGYKVADFINQSMRGMACTFLALIGAWKFSVAFVPLVPCIILSSTFMVSMVKKYTLAEFKAYGSAGQLAQETLSSVRTILAFGLQKKAIEAYSVNLVEAERLATKKGMVVGVLAGTSNALFNCCFAIALVYGSYLVRTDCKSYSPSNIIQAIFCIVATNVAFSHAVPFLRDIAEARGAARRVFDLIESSSISKRDDDARRNRKSKKSEIKHGGGKIIENPRGDIRLENVSFGYASRLSETVLQELSIEFPANKSIALVGPSGSGKSTIVSLLQRFYSPSSGRITLDGEPIESLDLNWYRSLMALVSQEPILFSTSIRENIRLGRLEATDEEIEEAARMANAHSFIMDLSDKYETHVGERGAQLSGGQKQRIAIARALIRNPKILILDEATSALDYESERVVQEALDQVKAGRTTIIVAHRLSTIRNADLIVVLEGGKFKEAGSHAELMDKKGVYYEMLRASQTVRSPSEDDGEKAESVTETAAVTLAANTSPKSGVDTEGVEDDNKSSSGSENEDDDEEEDQPVDLHNSKINESVQNDIANLTVGTHLLAEPNDDTCRNQDSSATPSLTYSAFHNSIRIKRTGENKKSSNRKGKKKHNHHHHHHHHHHHRRSRFYYFERKLFALNYRERAWLVIGSLAQMIYGTILPAISLVFSEIFFIFALPDEIAQRKLSFKYMWIILGIAVVNMASTVLYSHAFALAGAKLTKRIRVKMFSSMLRQEVAYHDCDENRSSILAAKLSSSAPLCKGLTTDKLSLLAQGFAGVGFAMLVALYINWKLALAMIAFVPVTFFNGVLAGRSSANTRVKGKFSNEEGGRILTETVENIRTIVSLGREQYFINEFCKVFDKKFHKQLALLHIQAFFYAMNNSLLFFIQAIAFGLGYYLMKTEGLTVTNIFRIYSSVTFSTMILGRVYAQLPDQRKSRDAAKTAFRIINRKSKMDSMSDEGLKLAQVAGDVRFESVYFSYPNRPDMQVLRDFTLNVKSGETNALVGSSGCGKSTIVSLLLRFYDVDSGAIYLDGVDIRKLNLNWLRSNYGLVSQEPVLFNTTIFENICNGDASRSNISLDEVVGVSIQSNIHNRIETLPEKYETVVGMRGNQLSGGEKQRIAIARALIRKPRILLLDEATSALDNQSEQVVQDALDKALLGRTCIVIAHRLSTIINSHKITVVKEGRVLEEGPHSQLLENKNFYYTLQNQ